MHCFEDKYGKVSLDLATQWIEILISNSKPAEANNLIDKYLADQPDNVNLWKSKLALKIGQTSKSNEKELVDLFFRAVKSIKPKVSSSK